MLSTGRLRIFTACFMILLHNKQNTAKAQDATPYYGKNIGNLRELSHGVTGMVYVVDDRRILIRQFSYDGLAPAAYFWIGLKGKSNPQPDKSGFSTPDENGSIERIKRKYNEENLVLTMSSGIRTSDLLWLSVWCKKFQVNFGHVMFPSDLVPPRPMIIGQFTGNSVHSGPISLLDHKTFLVEKFSFTGTEKDVLFVAGNGTEPNTANGIFQIPRENGGLTFLEPMDNVNVTLNFPDQLTAFDVQYISVYSERASINLGQVTIPHQLNVPPKLGSR